MSDRDGLAASDEVPLPDDELEAVAQAAFGAARAGGGVSEMAGAMLPELRLLAARVRAEAVAEERQRIAAAIAERRPDDAVTRRDKRWWGAFEHGLDCALADVAAGSVPVATPQSEREQAGGDGLRSVSRAGQLPGRLPVDIGHTSDTELLRDALQGWIDQRSSAFGAEDFDAAGSLLRRVDAVLATPEPDPTAEALAEGPGPSVGAPATEDVKSAPINPEFRQRLIAAANRSLRVRRAVLLLAGHAAGHLPGAEHACRTCHTDWPCEATHRAARPALEAFAKCDASLAASVVARLCTERDQLTAEVASTRVEVGRMGDLYASACEYGNEVCRGRDDLTAEVARYRAAIEETVELLETPGAGWPRRVYSILTAALGDGEATDHDRTICVHDMLRTACTRCGPACGGACCI